MNMPDYDDGGMAMKLPDHLERGRVQPVWHMLNSEWGSLCGHTEAADSENHLHSLTNTPGEGELP